MNEKMKGNKVKAEVIILKWMMDKGNLLKTESLTLYRPKMEFI